MRCLKSIEIISRSVLASVLLTTMACSAANESKEMRLKEGKAVMENTQDPRLLEFPTLHVVNHPLIQHKLTTARNKDTGSREFRHMLSDIALLIGCEMTKVLQTKDVAIETPITTMTGQMVDDNGIVIVPIMRAGMGMADGLHKLIPTADFAHMGLYRDHQTKKPVEYLFKAPTIKNQLFIVVDPMMATGNSAVYAVDKLKQVGVPAKNILFMALVVAPEGMRVFQKAHPEIPVYAASLDEKLNDNAYIVPGLGDAGDRLYGTE